MNDHDGLAAYIQSATRFGPVLTRPEERRLTLRIAAARNRYRAACLMLSPVADEVAGVLAKAAAGHLPLKREVIPTAATPLPAIAASLPAHLATLAALSAKAYTRASRGDHAGADRVRAKGARLLAELGVRHQKLGPAVAKAAHALPDELAAYGETADTLRAKVARVRRRELVYRRAKEKLAERNPLLVVNVAKKLAWGWAGELDDLIGHGNVGLMRAVDKYDVGRAGEDGRPLKFSTMAVWWIRQAITRAKGDQGRTVRVPGHRRELAGRVHQAREELKKAGRDATDAAVAEHLGRGGAVVEAWEVAKAEAAVQPVGWLDAEDGTEVVDDADSAADAAGANALRRDVAEAVNALRYRQREVVRLRFGLGDGHAYSLDQVGHIFGMTRERARQIQDEAVAALQRAAGRGLLRGHV